MYQVRTDLALEAREKFESDNVEIKGVEVKNEEVDGNMKITKVIIRTENGAKAMGKPRGNYITLEAPDMADSDEDYHREISRQLARILKELLPIEDKELS
ncbi:MAG: GPR endopeptidase, partial [Lachnospiraceae bacterium]|nr:GPR endopeptidase [Lachnospiraceae bacterium]